ncbi:peptidoglycan-associated lipoprotein Pal [Marinimicrobium sp. ABcell2]|uniref:peptidoglycan-associated lipoprotein Pal n=1 Tax=Marinimicrobium sp. ABcell2 TaxID=3069751 RepID=UPI0027B5B4A5|nr:peptidoglycan-associated lipoprotein Pal [Marinimicrobium sp. ABcell2]MDQ2075727.1 peptidoglycan-associated lipoprotein Pal [Marinimicrobium sp. ABcell2]
MINTFKAFLLALATIGLLAGCATATTEEQEPAPEMAETEEETQPAPETTTQIDTVFYFDFDRSTLKPAARAALTAHAERLKDSGQRVRIEGHTDERGSREYNMGLGERRAKAVRDFLVLQGVSANRIEVVSYGEERPVAMGSNESAWAQNRRAELNVQ